MHEQARPIEIITLCIVSAMSLAANLPDHLLDDWVDRKLLLITLAAAVVIALFHYLRVMLFISICILAVGANLPEELASQLSISTPIMLFSLGCLVALSIINHLLKLLPMEKMAGCKLDTPETRHAVLTAIMKGDLASLHHLLSMNVEINFMHNGTAPIFLATEKGYADIVLILLSHGAKHRVKDKHGKTPMEIAFAHKYTRIAEILNFASESRLFEHNANEPETSRLLPQQDKAAQLNTQPQLRHRHLFNK